MYSLLIDTHDTKVSFVLYKDMKVLSFKDFESNMRHSEVAMPSLIDLLTEFKINPEDLDEILVNIGPGSFTGVRIGVVIAKTMAYTLNIPIKMINSIEMLFYSNDSKLGVYVSKEKNGYFVCEINSINDVDNIKYYSNKEYDEKYMGKDVYNDVLIDFEKIIKYASNKEYVNPHLVNPLYIKQIEVLKW